MSLSLSFFFLPVSVLIGANYTASVLKPPWLPLTLLASFNVNSLAPKWKELPHFYSPIRKKKKSNTANAELDSFSSHALFSGSDCSCFLVKHRVRTVWIKPWGFWHFSFSVYFFFFFCFSSGLSAFWRGPRWWGGVARAYAEPSLSWHSCFPCGSGAAGGRIPTLGIWRSPHTLIQTPGMSWTGTNAAGYGTSSSYWRSTQAMNHSMLAR